jgi:hypothetical protein
MHMANIAHRNMKWEQTTGINIIYIRAIIDLIYIQSPHQFSAIKDIKTTIYNNSTGINQCKEANISK